MPFFVRVALHQRVEDPDLAGRAVIDHRPIEHGDHSVRVGEALPVFLEDRGGGRIAGGEHILVRDEDLDAVSAQTRNALVDEGPLVWSEQRSGEVDLHRRNPNRAFTKSG